MFFTADIPEAFRGQPDRPLVQKDLIPVGEPFRNYLHQHGRSCPLYFTYADLQDYSHTESLRDPFGRHTHWERVIYRDGRIATLYPRLLDAYLLLCRNEEAPNRVASAWRIEAIDFCEYANSMPFRITLSDNAGLSDYFFVKQADASRIYGLELEQLLGDTHIAFICEGDTLVERAIRGVFADDYLANSALLDPLRKLEAAKNFVDFNLRCFSRLLGDMRSYNFVVQDGQDSSLRFRAIDFDQQAYEGALSMYFPHFYSENRLLVDWVIEFLSPSEIGSIEHTTLLNLRRSAAAHSGRLQQLLEVLGRDELTPHYKFIQLRKALAGYHGSDAFLRCHSMGDLLRKQLDHLGIC
jgi:hypothetical protein